ncbi:MAG: hypothetical protein OES79_08200 [Planctomycetota bacterium]|nr:hypothetical protein [Planctomycetota bacterium]
MFRSLVFCLGLCALLTHAPVEAQDVVILQIYGEGVHDYFAGNYQEAQQGLTQVVDAGSRDPRAYFFRGLANQRMGFEDAANEDFRIGSELEAKYGGTEIVGRALTRVQGGDRLKLEKYRTEARMAVYQQRQRMRRDRFGAQPGVEQQPLPDGAVEEDGAPELLEEPADAAPAEASDDVFGEPAEEGAAEPEMLDEPMADPADDDLFGAENAEPAEGADEAGKAAEPAAEGDKPAAEADPFGDDPVQPEGDAEDDPFA